MLTSSESLAPGIHIKVVTNLPHPIPCRSTQASELAALAARPSAPAGIPELARFQPAVGAEPISHLTGGIGPLRFFRAQGQQISGAAAIRTLQQTQYVNVRRLTMKIESSIQIGLQWVVFENNGPALWGKVAGTVDGFMQNLFQQGAFQGSTPSQAYFVQCGPSTMTQADIDSGRLIVLVGFAPLYPAEFVVLQIGILMNKK